jgi:hypothetical protein
MSEERFNFLVLSFESSEPDTDPEGLGEAIAEAAGDLVDEDDVAWVDKSDWDTEDDFPFGGPPNLGQYTQEITLNFSRPLTMEEVEAFMEKVDCDSFGFGNGWEA